MKHVPRNALAAIFLAAVAASGCGLKGALTCRRSPTRS